MPNTCNWVTFFFFMYASLIPLLAYNMVGLQKVKSERIGILCIGRSSMQAFIQILPEIVSLACPIAHHRSLRGCGKRAAKNTIEGSICIITHASTPIDTSIGHTLKRKVKQHCMNLLMEQSERSGCLKFRIIIIFDVDLNLYEYFY